MVRAVQIEQRKWDGLGWSPESPVNLGNSAQLLLTFGSPAAVRNSKPLAELRRAYPAAHLLGCSTAGEICGTRVLNNTIVATAVQFEHTRLHGASIKLGDVSNSLEAGERLAKCLPPTLNGAEPAAPVKLAHVLVLSEGLKVNGSDLVRGLTQQLPEGVTATGGLAADGARFGETLVFWDSVPERDTVTVLGLYGDRLRIGFGCLGGWDSFGPERLITRSKGNVLYELDGHSALGLYKQYLGRHAEELPATGLLFPLSLRTRTGERAVVRTILSIDEQEQSLTFAGDVPEGAYARLMKANFDRLIDGATGAARTCYQAIGSVTPDLALLISCVGRKLVLKQRIEEEVEGVRDVLGEGTVLTGFYSYGEISPFTPGAKCELHNQTMTITTFSEV